VSDGPLGRRQCTATSKRSGERCRRSPLPGSNVCYFHGSQAGQAQRAAARRVAAVEALATFERYSPNGSGPVDVIEALGVLVSRVTSFADFATARIEALTGEQWAAYSPRTAAEVDLFRQALRDAGRLLTDLAKLGLDERHFAQRREDIEREVHAEAGGAVTRLIRRILDDFGLARDPRVAEIVPRRLKEVARELHPETVVIEDD
jgi:hypothetical protein